MQDISLFQWGLNKLSSTIMSMAAGVAPVGVTLIDANKGSPNLWLALMPLAIGTGLIIAGIFAGALILEVLKRRGLDLTISEKLEEQPARVRSYLINSAATVTIYAVTTGLPVLIFLRMNGPEITEQLNFPIIASVIITLAVMSFIQNRLYVNRQNKARQRLPGILTE